ncbi:hypothetical protein NLX83_06125 [Allokutzneria sp. A3M-2-11 16]|uniref:hypothetical protein n=1 Tax=Allokutzneria sp. A3M-2-11 16 TaxID=2962043 RepID=UPI0020B6813C|nr:hypothetical protein [Allokutzneria sp. A3M-2-11 16]MCP3798829.1 hypothetical protein [Allokutzneria sp. A3M-2-11 16]
MTFGKNLGTVALALGVVVATAPGASAGGGSKFCPAAVSCQLEVDGFPGGTLSVDADAVNGPDKLILLRVQTKTGQRCVTEFWVNEPPRSWVCHNIPPGKIRVTTTEAYVNSYDYSVGARWR